MQSKRRFLGEGPVLFLLVFTRSTASRKILTLIPSMEPMLMTDDVFSLDALAVKRGRQLQYSMNKGRI